MITVRFPSGFSVQYNALDRVQLMDNGSARLKKSSEPDHYYVLVPAECIVELTTPSRTYNASVPSQELASEVANLRKEIRSLSRKIAKLKESA